ncbi:hypothetical protein NQ318_001698 [Aromia moschata]|uniref:DUF4817 domain-containing protein n=1 Tax=Aromia moschata TaxID=1265417 RepID=A0AAV8Y4V0_9CUCU|nr:hypothetical protein NQ318_001698 [Aromia moschata]
MFSAFHRARSGARALSRSSTIAFASLISCRFIDANLAESDSLSKDAEFPLLHQHFRFEFPRKCYFDSLNLHLYLEALHDHKLRFLRGCIQLKQFETKCYFKLVKMSYLTESLKIEILMMIEYGDWARTQSEVVRLFRETHPDLPPPNQGTISKIQAQYREMGHVRKVPSKRQAVVDDDTKLNLLLALEENPITPARQLARDHKTVLKIFKYEKKRPYKMQAVQELLEDDPDRRVEFCDLLMTCIDQNQLSLEWIVFL